jgi:hypothetical protein
MNSFRPLFSLVLIAASVGVPAAAQKKGTLGENAALRYWAAFSAMQDAGISSQQAKEMNAILEGTAPYDDLKYKKLIEKNKLALEIMTRATTLPSCEWGLDYDLGEDIPVEYARKALALGRLNVLYAFHLLITGNKVAAVGTLAAGVRFSHDVANGGSLFATLAAKDLLENHFRAISFALHTGSLSAAQKEQLRKAIVQLGPDPLDWGAAARRDVESLRGRYATDPQASAALTQIITSYVGALNDPSRLPALQQVLDSAPKQVADLVPNAARVLEQKRELREKLAQLRSVLQ